MLSGVMYASGSKKCRMKLMRNLANAFAIFIMEGLGMAVGSLIWNVATAVWGWLIPRS